MDSRAEKLWRRGMVHFRQGKLEAAQASFEALLAREPGSGPGWFRLSLVSALRGRHSRAVAEAERALALGGDRVEVLSHLARCLLRSGAPERARAVAMQALAMPRDNPVVLHSLAGVLSRLEPALALELFDQAIELDSSNASLRLNRAFAQRQSGQLEAAEGDLEACLVRQPLHPKAHWGLATLRTHDLAGNHVPRLRRLLDSALPVQQEVLALALFKELDDLGDTSGAAVALARGLAARAARGAPDPGIGERHAALVERLVDSVDAGWVGGPGESEAAPVFVVGMPRSGVALLGALLSRHPRLHWLGTHQAWSPRLQAALGAEGRGLAAGDVDRAASLDFARLGSDYLAAVLPRGSRPPIACESAPLDYLQVGFMARALPGARFVHVVRDPVDTCASILFQPGGDLEVPAVEPAALAAYYARYARLMRHWNDLLPGRIIDVNYESLAEKPEMLLRVLCSFLGIRYASALRMGLQLHSRSIGRGHRYLSQLPGLGDALAREVRAA